MKKNQTKQRPHGLLALDTSSEAENIQLRVWREMSSVEKAQAVAEVTKSTRELSLAGIRIRHASATEEECRLRYAILTLGRRLACAAYPGARDYVER